MVDEGPEPRRTDPILLVEAGLVLLLFALFLVLYLRPAGEGAFRPEWWTWLVLGGLFFGIIALDMWRRKRRNRVALRETLRDARRPREQD